MERPLSWRRYHLPDNYPGQKCFLGLERVVQVVAYCAAVLAVIVGIAEGNYPGTILAAILLGFLILYPVEVKREPEFEGYRDEDGRLISVSYRREIDNYDRPEYLKAITRQMDYGDALYRNGIGDLYFRDPRLQELLEERQIPVKMHPLELLMHLAEKKQAVS